MKKCRIGRQAKIAPPRFPKEARDSTAPRCAMEATPSDHQMHELDESQEGLEFVSRRTLMGEEERRYKYVEVRRDGADAA
jgi:hypothetical protein